MTSKVIYSLIFWLTAMSVFAMPSNWKFGRPNLLTPVLIDNMIVKEIWIGVSSEYLLIDQEVMLEILQKSLRESYLEKFLALKNDLNYFTKKELEALGIKIIFDPNQLNLYLKIPLDMRKENYVDLLMSQSQRGILVNSADFSYFMNFNYNNNFVDGISDTEQLYNELNLNYQGFILNTGGFYTSANNKRYNREYTRFIKDLQHINTRLIAGDLNHQVVDIQEQFQGAGFTIQNDFTINPQLLRTNTNNYEIVLSQTSQVEIFINESRIYQSQHPAGVLNLNRLPLTVGLNEILVVVTGANGRQETFNFQTNYHANMLPGKLQDYSANILVSSNYDEENDLSYDYDERIFTGYYRYGINDNITAGINNQSKGQNNLSGIELSTAFSNLMLQGFYAQAQFDRRRASSYQVIFQNNPRLRDKFPIRFNFNYRFFEEDFTYISGTNNNIKTSKFFSSSYLFSNATSFGVGIESQQTYQDDLNEFLNFELIHRFNNTTNFSVRTQVDTQNSQNNSVLLTLNWFEPKNRNISGFHSYNAQRQAARNQVNYRKQIDAGNILISAAHDASEKEDYENSNLFGVMDSNIGTIRLDHTDNGIEKINNINLQFSLVGTNSRPYLSRYISNSYFIVTSNSESPIRLGNELGSYVSKSNPVVVNNLTPYQTNNISLNLDQLEFGEDLSFDHFTVKPTYLAGSTFHIETINLISLGFKILSSDPGKVKYATLTLVSNEQNIEVMTGKKGDVFLENLAPGTYSIFYQDKLIKVVDMPLKAGYVQLGGISID